MSSNPTHLLDPTPTETPPVQDPPAAGAASYFPFPLRSTIASTLRRLSSETLFSAKQAAPSAPQPRARPARAESFGEFQGGPVVDDEENLIDLDDLSEPTTTTYSTDAIPAPASKPAVSRQHDATPAPAPPRRSISSPEAHRPHIPLLFQPPPLTPLTLSSSSTSTQILTRQLAEEIRLLMPARLQLLDIWKLAFSLERDGSSLATLYDKSAEYGGRRGGFVLVVRDSAANIFGAYLSDPPRPSGGHYYGTGECFLWRCAVLPSLSDLSPASLPPPPSADTTHATRMTTISSPEASSHAAAGELHVAPLSGVSGGFSGTSSPDRIRFTAFPYSGINDYMIFCEQRFLSVGGGDGHYGLWLDGSLEKGVSDSCPTFGNEPLSVEGTKFDILGVEVWHLGV